MATAELTLLKRYVESQVLSPYSYQSPLRYFASERVGDIDKEKWLHKHLKTLNEAVTSTRFHAGGSSPDFDTSELRFYRTSHRINFEREEYLFFEKNGFMDKSFGEVQSQMNLNLGNVLWHGPTKGHDHVGFTQYNYLIDAGSGNGTYVRPNLAGDEDTTGAWNTAPNMLSDAAKMAGNLISHGYNPATSIVFYPEIAAPNMLKPVVTSSTTQFFPKSFTKVLTEDFGFMGVEPVPTAWFTKSDLATAPTAASFDLLAVDMSSCIVGYNMDENIVAFYEDQAKMYYSDFEVGWLFYKIPKLWYDSKIYWGGSRIKTIVQS